MSNPIAIDKRVGSVRSELATDILLTLRPKEWIKNSIILAPLFFSQNVLDAVATGRTLAAVAIFCLMSSSVYLLNDVRDRDRDRLHPIKSQRPIAAGRLGEKLALGIMSILLIAALGGGYLLSPSFALILIAYWLINLLYSFGLKNLVILDVFAIAFGFVLRVIGGAVVIEVEMSHWLIICTTLLALFLGFSKRRHELFLLGNEASGHRHVLEEYSASYLDMMIGIVTASTVMSYALYTVSEETVRRFNSDRLVLTLPFVLYGIFRYLYLIYHKNQGGNPARDLLTDKSIIVNLALWAAVTGIILYWK
jgi:4-hydroxybenzoate polyprenyltransferase